jgi:voltage-gated potassium channel
LESAVETDGIDDSPAPTVNSSLSLSYQLFILVLSIFAVMTIGAQTFGRLEPETKSVLDYADFGVCVIFFADFVWSLYRAPNRWRYFLTHGWLDLVSSIPTLDIARWGRLARIARIIRLIRVIRATRVIAGVIGRSRGQSGVLAIVLSAFLLIVFCSIAVLQFESDGSGNIKTAEDAIWWAFTTVTTVGYGDRFPVTGGGRLVASLLMFAGVGLFSTMSGLLAAWFLAPARVAENESIDALRRDIAKLRSELSSWSDSMRSGT